MVIAAQHNCRESASRPSVHRRMVAWMVGGAIWFSMVAGGDNECLAQGGVVVPAHEKELESFLDQAISRVVTGQRPDGGWGEGHASHGFGPSVRLLPSDPANTAIAVMALIRAGNLPDQGAYRTNVAKGLEFLLQAVEGYPEKALGTIEPLEPIVSFDQTLTERRVRRDFGPLIDTTATAHCLAEILPALAEGQLRTRVYLALGKCVRRLQLVHSPNSAWPECPGRTVTDLGSGDARGPLRQSELALSALERADVASVAVNRAVVDSARRFFRGDDLLQRAQAGCTEAGRESPLTARDFRVRAGEIQTLLVTTLRSTAVQARVVEDLCQRDGEKVNDGLNPTTVVNRLARIGLPRRNAMELADVWKINYTLRSRIAGGRKALPVEAAEHHHQPRRADEVSQFAGRSFDNGGNEIDMLDYLTISESLVIVRAPEWDEWKTRMLGFLLEQQARDRLVGRSERSAFMWNTPSRLAESAVVLSLTADRCPALTRGLADRERDEILRSIGKQPPAQEAKLGP